MDSFVFFEQEVYFAVHEEGRYPLEWSAAII